MSGGERGMSAPRIGVLALQGDTREHLAALRAAGVLVTVNTDDPALIGTDLAREYATCAAAWHWDFDQMAELALDAVEASWLDDDGKRGLSARVRAAAATLRPGQAGTGRPE